MKASSTDLQQIFSDSLQAFYSAERMYARLYKRFYSLAFTDELRSSLSPERNELKQQTNRLLQVLKFLKLRPAKATSALDEVCLEPGTEFCRGKRKGALSYDVDILAMSKQIYSHRIARLDTLETLARLLDLESPAMLLEQSGIECRNALAYLCQIERNILYPQI